LPPASSEALLQPPTHGCKARRTKVFTGQLKIANYDRGEYIHKMLRLFKQYYPARNIFFILGEGLFIYSSVILATWLLIDLETFTLDRLYSRKALLITVVCHICLYYNDLYDLQVTDSYFELSIRLLQALGVASIVLAGVYIAFPHAIIGKGIFIVSVGFVTIFIISWRFLYTFVLNRGLLNQKIILIGSSELARKIMKEISYKKDCGYSVSGVVQDCQEDIDFMDEKRTAVIYKKEFEGLCDIAKELNTNKIVVAIKERRGSFPAKELLKCRVNGIDILEGNSFYEMLSGKLIVEQINPAWLIFSEGFRKSRLRRFFKCAIDLVISIVMMILLFPVNIMVAILIKIDSKGPVFFSQERVGENRKIYRLHKFRSMVVDAEKKSGPTWAKDKDERVTRIGKFIRKWRIDELPQLWNVLKGDMSFVGPRPEREFFINKLEQIIPYYGERFTVKPGITGWAQVSYGYGASVEDAVEKLNYDLFYIKNMSIFMDLMIVMRTVKTVLFGKGAR